jgi:hypothetical protein
MKKSVFLAACVAALAVTLVASAAPVANGDFETGDLTGWSTFLTAGGVISPGPPVASFDTTGSGASNAATFAVGRNNFGSAPEGGGIYQSVNTAAGSFNVSADIAARGGSSANAACGIFEILVDGVVVDSHDFSPIPFDDSQCPADTTVRATLSAPGLPLTAGLHEVRVRITRGFGLSPITSTRPRQYVDNVSLTQVTAGMPTTKDQGKRGAWEDYPVFKDQGDCVSFVASGGKNPPANG